MRIVGATSVTTAIAIRVHIPLNCKNIFSSLQNLNYHKTSTGTFLEVMNHHPIPRNSLAGSQEAFHPIAFLFLEIW